MQLTREPALRWWFMHSQHFPCLSHSVKGQIQFSLLQFINTPPFLFLYVHNIHFMFEIYIYIIIFRAIFQVKITYNGYIYMSNSRSKSSTPSKESFPIPITSSYSDNTSMTALCTSLGVRVAPAKASTSFSNS